MSNMNLMNHGERTEGALTTNDIHGESDIRTKIGQTGRKIRHLLTTAGLLAAGAVSGISVAACSKNTPKQQTASADAPPEKPEEKKRQFDPDTYSPPQEGVIISKNIQPANKKTVVFIGMPDTRGNRNKGLQAQGEIFRIVEKAVQDYGTVPLVLESWTYYGPDTFERNLMKRDDQAWDISTIKDRGERIRAAQNIAGRLPLPAGQLLAAAYKDEVLPIPSHSTEDQIAELEQLIIFSSFCGNALRHNEQCSVIPGVRSNEGIRDAARDFFRENLTEDVLQCYCTFHVLGNEINRDFDTMRYVTMAEKEAGRAMDDPSPATFIIAESMQTQQVLKTVGGRHGNAIIVAAASEEPAAREALKTTPYKEEFTNDDSHSSCAEWANSHQSDLDTTRRIIKERIHERAQKVVEGYDTEWNKKKNKK